MSAGSLVVTFLNNHKGTTPYVGEYHFVFYRECDPNTILETFQGKLAYGEQESYTIRDLRPGNYLLVGLKLPDPKPGNTRTHRIMIYSGLETIYDVCYLKSSKVKY